MIKGLRNNKAFTIMELLIVVGIIGVLVGIAQPRFTGFTKEARFAAVQQDIKVLEDASSIYNIDNDSWPYIVGEDNIRKVVEESKASEIKSKFGLKREHFLYHINKDKLKNPGIVRLKNRYKDYVFTTSEDLEGYVFHLKSGVSRDSSFEDYKGSSDSPEEINYSEISTAKDLAEIGVSSERTLDMDYIQVADIDLSSYSSGEGWVPIGDNSTGSNESRFTGKYDGGGFKITGLAINRPGESRQGLFGMTSGALIENVGIEDGSISGGNRAGLLVGSFYDDSVINNSYTTGQVSSEGENVGGLVGIAHESHINDSHSLSKVKSNGGRVGGVAGSAWSSTIKNSYSINNVSGKEFTGGVVGLDSSSTIENSHSVGDVNGTTQVGGVTGKSQASSTIVGSHSDGSVSGTETHIGGLVGHSSNSTIKESYSSSDVSGNGYTGGIAGVLVQATIDKSHATGKVNNSGNYTGGLVGVTSNASIDRSYHVGEVRGGSLDTGGLVGANQNSNISNSYSTSSVTGVKNVGGIIGRNIVGRNTLKNVYATGYIKGGLSNVNLSLTGALVGSGPRNNTAVVVWENTYWNTQTSGQDTPIREGTGVSHFIGKTVSEMKQQSTYVGWDFNKIWEIKPGQYPTLR